MTTLGFAGRMAANTVRGLIGQRSSLAEIAQKTEILQEEERVAVTPPLQLPGDTDKVTEGVPGHSTAAEELAVTTQTEMIHAPVIRWEIEDCLVHPAGIDARGAMWRHRRPISHDLTCQLHSSDRSIYCDNGASQIYFGHWLNDACPTALLARDDEEVLLDQNPNWGNVPQYLGALALTPVPAPMIHVRKLAFLQDHGQGSLKARRYAEMRRRVAAHLPSDGSGPKRVYFRRGATGVGRVFAEEDALTAALVARGFHVVDVAGATLKDLRQQFADADLVVTIDGSHMSHLYFTMRPETTVLTLIPSDRFTMLHAGYTHACNLRFGFLVVDASPAGYVVDVDRLHALIDMAETA